MAEAAIEKIKDILSCCICSEELRDPIGLPCLHVFCYECLYTWHQAGQDKMQVVCPACKRSSPVPEGGIREFPKHTLVKDLKETIHIQAAEPEHLSCTVCRKHADSHCIDCDKSLCQSCLENHNTFTKGHKVISAKEYQSGKVSAEGRLCKVHEEQVRYYCETEEKQVCMDCISLKTCPIEHARITLKEAAKKHISSLDALMKKCTANKMHFDNAVAGTVAELDDLNQSIKQIKAELIQIKQQYVKKIDQVFDQQISDLEHIHKYRVKAIGKKKDAHESAMGTIDEACEEAENLLSNKVEYQITNKYSSMSKLLKSLSTTKPLDAGRYLGYIRFEPATMEVPQSGRLVRRQEWKLCDQFHTQMDSNPHTIAINHEDDIAIASNAIIQIYSKENKVKHSFYNTTSFYRGIGVSNDNRYIVADSGHFIGIRFIDKHGKCKTTIPVTDTQGKKCNINSIAVDSQGRIIVGLGGNAISIHYGDGNMISRFSTADPVNRLAVTSKGLIVVTFGRKNTLELIDYHGTTIKIIAPPPNIKSWCPGFVCCAKDEIFVVNDKGDPQGVFRYTAGGDYLGYVTKEVSDPAGIALSHDSLDLFVVERNLHSVKVFHRE